MIYRELQEETKEAAEGKAVLPAAGGVWPMLSLPN